MPYWRIYCHLTWSTKGREPWLVENVAQVAERSLRATAEDLKVMLHAIHLMPNHVHMAVSIPPSLAIANVVARFKGGSSHLVNHEIPTDDQRFSWQTEYGVVSFREKQLPDVIAYIKNQPERHAENRLWDIIERDTDEL